MNVYDVTAFANHTLSQHGLISQGWRFSLNNRSRHIGLCDYRKRMIFLSQHFLHIGEVEIKDTILHEVAHVLAPRGSHHNWAWQAKAIELGARPTPCKSVAESTKPPKYKLACLHCGHSKKLFRKPKYPRSCGKCSPRVWNEKYRMVLLEVQREIPTT